MLLMPQSSRNKAMKDVLNQDYQL
uniref:Uncharacterized protein n=1 Tax=Rhizophora mucronata TaxID=61149 RepID=A0A2P2P555_RHIMU